MINVTFLQENKLLTKNYLDKNLTFDKILWIDILFATEEEKKNVEDFLDIKLQTRQESEEIESSSRYFETEDEIFANSNFLVRNSNNEYHNEPVSFIIKNRILISYRNIELKAFDDTLKKILASARTKISGFDVFLSLFETRIDLDADLLEALARDISSISKQITVEKHLDESIIIDITKHQETTMLLRENIIDKQRVMSAILKSEFFPKTSYELIRIMIKDIGSLIDHNSFSFERLEYLQDTFLGLVDIEQNKIIKIFTVATVLFMPPTLIASIYGMNFKFMPELYFKYGYAIALILMLLSALITLLIFRKKKWL